MKFDNTIATGFITGSCIGAVIAEILFRPSVISYLWTADIMLGAAIMLGLVFGGLKCP